MPRISPARAGNLLSVFSRSSRLGSWSVGGLLLVLSGACSSKETPSGGQEGDAGAPATGGGGTNDGGSSPSGGSGLTQNGGTSSTSGGSGGEGAFAGSSAGTNPGGAGGTSGSEAGGTGGTAGASNGAGMAGVGGSGGAPATYANPIVPGFHPDPSIVRVDTDYYLVTSSFEYFPGIPIFTSKDLVNWRQIGHVLTRSTQAPLGTVMSSEGVFAPTIRHHDGTFTVVSSIVNGGDLFYVTATNPAGPWSEPTWLRESVFGMDPSLFFDDDGKVYYTRHGDGEQGGIFQSEINLATGALAAAPREIWGGTGGVWPEGPHLYKIDGTYYLMISEGGTSYEHSETIARSSSPFGPFEAYSGNPILTHRGKTSPIQATGHGDLVQTASGAWWLVFLGIRPTDGAHHHLGRETFLAPVTWGANDWPVVNGGSPIALVQSAAGLPAPVPVAALPPRDDFTTTSLPFTYNFVRNPNASDWSLGARSGFLRLRGTTVGLNSVGSPAFVGRRQEHFRVRASTLLEFVPTQAGQEAGLVIRANESNHYELAVTYNGSRRRASLHTRVAGTSRTVMEQDLADGAVSLVIEAVEDHYEFFYAVGSAARVSLGTALTAPLSSESAGGFTGVYFGMYAQASSGTTPNADFDWFEYQPL